MTGKEKYFKKNVSSTTALRSTDIDMYSSNYIADCEQLYSYGY